ncbi:hypothetical protein AB0B12_14760 [Streptomyces sp. NPDC044780]|uniref:hypothetical protein n=1 Tax=unclassified Streptomyces TaxID=2593676 RepID=UPI0033CBC684
MIPNREIIPYRAHREFRKEVPVMEQSFQSTSVEHTRRGVLAAAGVATAALLGACSSSEGKSSSSTLQVDFGKAEFFPLLKSKIGVGRALSMTEILDSLPYMDQIRPAVYDGEIRFPETDYPSLTPYPFVVGENDEVSVLPNEFLEKLFTGLQRRNMEIMIQLMGAPKQWWDYEKAKRPHLFPMPTDLTAAADAIGKWTKLYSDYPISWCMWNEPSHNLTGSPNRASVRQMVDIYDAYTNAIAPRGLFGMASFIKTSAPVREKLGGRTHLQATIDALRKRVKAKSGLPFDYLTLNSYGADLDELFAAARNALGTDFNTVPIIQAQSGVFKPHEWGKRRGTTLEAVRSMVSLKNALQVPDLQTFTFSGWIPHLIEYKGGEALQLPLFNALKLYARMPDRRGSVQGELPSGIGAMASSDQYRSAVLVWNETSRAQSIDVQMSHLQSSSRGEAELRVYLIDSKHGSPLEHSDNKFVPTEVTTLDELPRSLSKTVTVAGPGIAYIEVGTKSAHPVLDRNGLDAELVRKHTFADRIPGSKNTTSVRGNAYGCYDAVRAIAYVGVEGNAGTALVGAEYRKLPDSLKLEISADTLASDPKSSEAMFGIRVDYLLADEPVKSVLWHGDTFDSRRKTPLPWGRGGPTADVVVEARELDRARADQAKLVLPLEEYAPSGWAQASRHAIISFWMDSTGPGSQARFLLE